MKQKNQSLTRQQLYDLAWAEPVLKIADRFNVSSSYMARVCSQLDVPRPPRGYWAKLAAGKKVKQPPLPPPQPGTPLEWSKGQEYSNFHRPLPKPPSFSQRKSRVVKTKSNEHFLLSGAKNHFSSGRLSREGDYLIPAKKLLVDLVVSKSGLDPALIFAKKFFTKLESKEYRVVIAPDRDILYRASVDILGTSKGGHDFTNLWSPIRCTVAYIGTVAIGLTIIEAAEEIEVRYVNGKYIRVDQTKSTKTSISTSGLDWTTHKKFPTGKLGLQAYSPYPRADWVRKWQEKKKGGLNSQINSIISELENASIKIAKLVEEGERQAEIERKRHEAQMKQWRIEKEKLRRAKAFKDSQIDLHNIINNWAEANRIDSFFNDVEKRAESLAKVDKMQLLEQLKKARKLIGSTDALDHFLNWKSPEER